MKRLSEFFQESSGQFSMTRLLTFFNALVAVFVTVASVVKPEPLTTNEIAFVFELWILTYAGKHAGKHLEKLQKNE